MKRISLTVVLLLVFLLSACNIGPRPVETVPTLVFGDANGETQPAPTEEVVEDPTDELTATPEPTQEDDPVVEPEPIDPTPVVVKQPTQTPLSNLNKFGQKLAQVVEARDFDGMRDLMSGRFSIATFNTELNNYDSDEALDMLRGGKFAPGSTPAVRFGTDIVTLLNGADPLDLWGPVADPVKALHVMGLSSNGSEEAVLVIGREDDGSFYWLGLLVPQGGYFQLEDAGDVLETEIEWVEALDELNVRSGPGLNYAIEGRVRKGEIARVTGISASRQWWRISCTQDASGNCWISALDDLTRPASAP